ncbi:MAG: hypothetical protein KAV68_04860 [Dehalococcoidales bacterium]|nr:hypothetical protein [Dehalococcoidales bacterium]
MARKRYDRLVELERAGRLRYGSSEGCPECQKPWCCYRHGWVNHKWWEGIRPTIEMIRLKTK